MPSNSEAAARQPSGLREALEEAIMLPLGGGFQMKQAAWRKVATEYDRAALAADPAAQHTRVHINTCLLIDTVPEHNGPCAINQDEVDDYSKAVEYGSLCEVEMRRALYGLRKQERERYDRIRQGRDSAGN